MLQVFNDDFVEVAFIHIGVPHPFGIDHQYRAVITTIHAACRIDADTIFFIRLILESLHTSGTVDCKAGIKKTCYRLDSRLSCIYLGWLMGLEPTTTGITILDSTN